MTITENSINRAEDRLRDAKTRLNEAKSALEQDYISNPSKIVLKAQRSIELSAKAAYDLVDIEPPTEHQIPYDDRHGQTEKAEHIIENELSELMLQKFVRLVMLTRIWGATYPQTEYGQDRVSPDDIFAEDDAERACEYADEASLLTRQLLSEAYSTLH